MSFLRRFFRKSFTPQEIVADYGKVLQAAPLSLRGLRDQRLLPHSKATIEAAILELISWESIDPDQRAALERGLLELASFQTLDVRPMPMPDSDISNLDPVEMKAFAEKILSANNDEHASKMYQLEVERIRERLAGPNRSGNMDA